MADDAAAAVAGTGLDLTAAGCDAAAITLDDWDTFGGAGKSIGRKSNDTPWIPRSSAVAIVAPSAACKCSAVMVCDSAISAGVIPGILFQSICSEAWINALIPSTADWTSETLDNPVPGGSWPLALLVTAGFFALDAVRLEDADDAMAWLAGAGGW